MFISVKSRGDVAAGVGEAVEGSSLPGIIGCTAACGTLAATSTILRMYARFAGSKRILLHDWLFILSLCFYIIYMALFTAVSLHADRPGHADNGSIGKNTRTFGICHVVEENFFALAIAYFKFSLLTLYDAHFATSRNFRRCLLVIGMYTATWVTATVLVTTIQCFPIEYMWNSSIEGGRCLNYYVFNIVITAANVIGSFALLVVPVPMVLRMTLSQRKKILFLIAFGIGTATCSIGMVRFTFACKSKDTSHQDPDLAFNVTSAVELTLAVLCAALPTYGYFFPGFDMPTISGTRLATRGTTQHLHPRTPAHISVRITGGATTGPRRSGIAVTDDISRMTHAHVNGTWVRVPDEDERALFPLAVHKASHSTSGSDNGRSDE